MGKVLAVRIDKSVDFCTDHKKGFNRQTDLYDCARGGWYVFGRKKAPDVEYVLAVYKGNVEEVYKVDENGWYTLPMKNMPAWRGAYSKNNDTMRDPSRWCFEGKKVEDKSKFPNKVASSDFSNPYFPVTYLEVDY